RPGGAHGSRPLGPVAVGHRRLGRVLRTGGAVARGLLVARVVQLLALVAHADHQDRARPVAGADDDVVGPGRAVEEVPGLEVPFLILDDQQALAREHEEVLLHALGVVAAVRLARLEDVDADPVLLERCVPRLPRGPLAGDLVAVPPAVGEERTYQPGDETAAPSGVCSSFASSIGTARAYPT